MFLDVPKVLSDSFHFRLVIEEKLVEEPEVSGCPLTSGRRKVFLDGGANILQRPPDSMGPLERGPLPIFYDAFFTDTGAFFKS